MAASLEEQLDELISLARDAGEAATELAAMERDRDAYPARSGIGRRARQFLPNDQRRVHACEARLAAARARMLQRCYREMSPGNPEPHDGDES